MTPQFGGPPPRLGIRGSRPGSTHFLGKAEAREAKEGALAVYAAAGYRPDSTDRVSHWRGTQIRELRLVNAL